MEKYEGRIKETKKITKGRYKINWVAFTIWLVSIILSFVPIYAHILVWLISNGSEQIPVREIIFECITKQDMLWVFSTVLLFSLMNAVVNYRTRRRKKGAMMVWGIIGIALFVFLEITWGIFKYVAVEYAAWVVNLSIVLMIASLIVATPLQIDTIECEV